MRYASRKLLWRNGEVDQLRWALALIFLALIRQSGWSQGALPPGFVRLREIVPSIYQDIRYAGPFNFTGQIVPGYDRAECILRESAAKALAKSAISAHDRRLRIEGL
jgi:D-alanyl-D-alanine dipeptidase